MKEASLTSMSLALEEERKKRMGLKKFKEKKIGYNFP